MLTEEERLEAERFAHAWIPGEKVALIVSVNVAQKIIRRLFEEIAELNAKMADKCGKCPWTISHNIKEPPCEHLWKPVTPNSSQCDKCNTEVSWASSTKMQWPPEPYLPPGGVE